MKKIKLTCAYAIVKHIIAQKILIDGKKNHYLQALLEYLAMEMLHVWDKL